VKTGIQTDFVNFSRPFTITAGTVVCTQIEKTSLIDLSLERLIRKLYGFTSFDVVQGVFPDRTGSGNAFRMHSGQFDAFVIIIQGGAND
jgi:hypothetical protein